VSYHVSPQKSFKLPGKSPEYRELGCVRISVCCSVLQCELQCVAVRCSVIWLLECVRWTHAGKGRADSYIHIYIYVYSYTCIRTYVHTEICVLAHTPYIYTYMVCELTHAEKGRADRYIHTYIHILIHVYMDICVLAHTPHMYMNMNVYVYTPIYICTHHICVYIIICISNG